MALAQAEITIELREISLKDRPKQLRNISKKATVPVLQLQDGTVIDESLNIMLWCTDIQKAEAWLQDDKALQLQLIEKIDNDFKPWLDRYKYHQMHPEYSREYYQGKCSKILSEFEERLNSQEYLMGAQLQIADVAIFPFIRQFANVDNQWFSQTFKELDGWIGQITVSELFQSVMKKYEFWKPVNEPRILNFLKD